MRILVTGSLAFDYIMDFPGKFSEHILPEKIHILNLSFLVERFSKQWGGTAGNIAYNLALLGIKPTILATAGADFGEYRKFLEDNGIDTSKIKIIKNEPTSFYFGITDQADNQIGGFYGGAMRYAKNLSLKTFKLDLRPWVRNKGIILVVGPTNPGAMIKFVKEAQDLGIPYMFDPGMQLPRLSSKDLKMAVSKAKILIGNDYEMAVMYKKLNIKKQKYISKLKNGQVWVTTLGEKGSIIKIQNPKSKIQKLYIKAAKPKNTSDPTGAGDAYRAGFLAGFLRGFGLKTCGQMGSVCAVYTVERYGTITHKFTLREFAQRYKENFGEAVKL